MNFAATLRIALDALRVNKLRSALTMLGIVIGVAAVIAMIAVGSGAQSRVDEQIRSLGANVMMVTPASANAGGVRMGAATTQTLTEDDARAIALEVAEVAWAAPLQRSSAQVVAGGMNWLAVVWGATNEFFEVREWPLAAGRTFEPAELSGAGKVVILGQTVVRELYGDGVDPESLIDQVVRVRNVPLTVVGVLAAKGQSAFGQDQDDVVVVPLTTARNRLFGALQGKLRRIGSISIKVQAGASMEDAEERIRALLRQRHKLQPGQEDDFTVRNLTELARAQEASSRAMAWLLGAIASVSLLVGGIGIMNIMLVSVTERTREIGLRMAVGARPREILAQFLVESITLSCIGGVLGTLLGVGVAVAVGRSAGWRIDIEPASVVLAFGFAAAIGVFFGFYPARRAANLEPIDALRHE